MEGHPGQEWDTSWVTRQGHPEETRGKWRVTRVKNGTLLGSPDRVTRKKLEVNGGSPGSRVVHFLGHPTGSPEETKGKWRVTRDGYPKKLKTLGWLPKRVTRRNYGQKKGYPRGLPKETNGKWKGTLNNSANNIFCLWERKTGSMWVTNQTLNLPVLTDQIKIHNIHITERCWFPRVVQYCLNN